MGQAVVTAAESCAGRLTAVPLSPCMLEPCGKRAPEVLEHLNA